MPECKCSDYPDAFYLDDFDKGIEKSMEYLESGDWVSLHKCPSCNSLWAVDAWDKYSFQVASRVESKDNWQPASEFQRKQLLIQSRGGLEQEACQWAKCDHPRVKNVAYCVHHLYETGARK